MLIRRHDHKRRALGVMLLLEPNEFLLAKLVIYLFNRMQKIRFNTITAYHGDVAFWGDMRLQQKGDLYLPQFWGGGFSKIYQVISQTHLSRFIILRHYTSWSTDSTGNNNLCDVTAAVDDLFWKHFCVDAYFSWVRRWQFKLTGDPRTDDTINDDLIIKCSPDVILCRYHVLITFF